MLKIRELVSSDIERYLDVYLNAYPAFKTLDVECRARQRERNLRNMELSDVDYIGMFDGEELVAAMKLVHFQMNLYGNVVPALGLMSLAVHPLHKKKGLALKMVQYYEARAVEMKASVAPLLPFNMTFYRSMGYGLGSRRSLYHIPTVNLPKGEISADLRFVRSQELDTLVACYNEKAARTHGMIRKTGEELGDMRADTASIRLGAYDGQKMTGYLSYRFEDASETNFTQNRIVVDELICLDAETLESFLEYLRRQADLAQSVVLTSGCDDFYHVLADPQDLSMEYLPYGYLQVCRSFIGYMYKIVDYPEFFRVTSNRPTGAGSVTARIEYLDAFAKEERFLLLDIGGERGGWRLLACGTAGSPDDVRDGSEGSVPELTLRCRECDLNALLMNSARLMPLIDLGVVRTDNTDAARRMDMILYYSSKPYSNTDF